MNKKTFRIVMLFVFISIAIAGAICMSIFNTSFAKGTIDYFSFFAAGFLIIDGVYKIVKYRNEPYLPDQLIRNIRVIKGACVMTIHIMQFVYGV